MEGYAAHVSNYKLVSVLHALGPGPRQMEMAAPHVVPPRVHLPVGVIIGAGDLPALRLHPLADTLVHVLRWLPSHLASCMRLLGSGRSRSAFSKLPFYDLRRDSSFGGDPHELVLIL
jgi:hypothetical protein